MKRVYCLITIVALSTITLTADESDWVDDSWDNKAISEMEQGNDTFKKIEIKNRSKREYDDKVYKYIENRDYNVKNNSVEIATVQLDNDLRNSDIEINVLTENLKVEGDKYRGDGIDFKRNDYKHFVKHDDLSNSFDKGQKEDENQEHKNIPLTLIEPTDPLYQKVDDEDISELEVIDLRDKYKTREVNVYIKDTRIRVGSNYEDR